MLSKLATVCVVAAIACVSVQGAVQQPMALFRREAVGNPGADDFDFSKASIGDIQQLLISMLGEECTNAVKKGVTKELFECMMAMEDDDDNSGDDDDDGFTEQGLKEMCNNNCMGAMFKAANAFVEDEECSDTAGLAGFGIDVDYIEQQEAFMAALCAKSNGMYCGLVADVVGQAVETQSITKKDCQTIVDAGFCLGSLSAAFDAAGEFFGPTFIGVNSTSVINGLDSACVAEGVTGISEAASSTEAPGVSAAATTAAGAFAAVALATAALLF
jgi:hypothetical protein